jgi:hypothetical protein
MDEKQLMIIIMGIGFTLLAFFIWPDFPFYLFPITLGIMTIISGFYTEGKKIKVSVSYFVAMFSVNIVQWLFLINIYYHYPFHLTGTYYLNIIIALLITLFLVNQVRKKYLKSSETKINMLTDKTKLILLFIGAITIIGSLVGLIAYYTPIFLYGITLGAIVLVYRYYNEGKRVNVREGHDNIDFIIRNVNVTWNYAKAMGTLIILQFLILCIFVVQIGTDVGALAITLWLNILLFFIFLIRSSDL